METINYGIVLVTAATETEAKELALALVQAQLAACVSLFPIQSVYTWQEQVEQTQEWQLLIKTHLAKFSALEAKIREIHSYEVPEILALPIQQGSAAYLNWLATQVKL